MAGCSESNLWEQQEWTGIHQWTTFPDQERIQETNYARERNPVFAIWGESAFFMNTFIRWHFQDNPVYNAYERDIAVVNIFFGQSTAFGKSIWWGFLIPPLSLLQSSQERKRWPGLILPPISGASLESPSASALSLFSNFSIGSPSDFAKIWQHSRNRNSIKFWIRKKCLY